MTWGGLCCVNEAYLYPESPGGIVAVVVVVMVVVVVVLPRICDGVL